MAEPGRRTARSRSWRRSGSDLNGWYISSVGVTLQATSPSGATILIAYSIDGGAWATYSTIKIVAPLGLRSERLVHFFRRGDAPGDEPERRHDLDRVQHRWRSLGDVQHDQDRGAARAPI